MRATRPTIQSLLQQHLGQFSQSHPVSSEMHNAAVRMRDCRTAAMGGHVNSCPEGHVDQIAYNSCRHRACPQCNGLARARWLEGWRRRLLPCPHYHTIFTTPHELLPLWQYNKKQFANALFFAATRTLIELLDDPKYLGGRVGLLAALHTWSQTLLGHVHLHVLITAGGVDSEGKWRRPVRSCLLPRKVLMIKFRGKLRATLIRMLDRGELALPPDTTESKLRGLLNKVGRKVWNVRIQECYAHGDGVATYLARYLKGGPIGNRRLLGERAGHVSFGYRLPSSHRTERKGRSVMQLAVSEFIRRLLEHVPPRGFQTVRGYGVYGGNQHARLDEAHLALGGQPVDSDKTPLTVEAFLEAAGQGDLGKCPQCGAALVSHSNFARGRPPPPLIARSLSHRKGVA